MHVVAISDKLLDKTFAALAHPTRRAILTQLAQNGSASVTDLAEPFDVTLMAVSKHLKVMDEAGLIRREKDGRVHRCSFDPASLQIVSNWIEDHRKYWTQQLDSLAAYLEGPRNVATQGSATEAESERMPYEGRRSR